VGGRREKGGAMMKDFRSGPEGYVDCEDGDTSLIPTEFEIEDVTRKVRGEFTDKFIQYFLLDNYRVLICRINAGHDYLGGQLNLDHRDILTAGTIYKDGVAVKSGRGFTSGRFTAKQDQALAQNLKEFLIRWNESGQQ
jgi:hypothetical protein